MFIALVMYTIIMNPARSLSFKRTGVVVTFVHSCLIVFLVDNYLP